MGLKLRTDITCDVCGKNVEVRVTKQLRRGRYRRRSISILHGLWLVTGDFDIDNQPDIKVTRTVYEWDLEESDFEQKLCCSEKCGLIAFTGMLPKLKEQQEEEKKS